MTMTIPRRALLAASPAVLAAPSLRAQPVQRDVRFVVGFAAGGRVPCRRQPPCPLHSGAIEDRHWQWHPACPMKQGGTPAREGDGW